MKGRTAQVDEAVRTLQKQSGPVTDAAIPMYRRLAVRVLSRPTSEEAGSDQAAVVAALKEVFYRLGNQYRSQSKHVNPDIEEILMATHYQNMFHVAQSNGLKEIALKAAITIMKYPDIVAQDKAFYQAGNAAKDLGNNNFAFMLLNKYVDITEAIDTNDASFMDNSDFQGADAIPLNVALPESHYVDNEVRWLSISSKLYYLFITLSFVHAIFRMIARMYAHGFYLS